MELPEPYRSLPIASSRASYEETQDELFERRIVKYGGAGAETWYFGWDKVLHYPGESEIWSDTLPLEA
jgi:hypothetical protein